MKAIYSSLFFKVIIAALFLIHAYFIIDKIAGINLVDNTGSIFNNILGIIIPLVYFISLRYEKTMTDKAFSILAYTVLGAIILNSLIF